MSISQQEKKHVYYNNNGRGKSFWGPPVWQTIHIFAATLRPESSKAFIDFLWLLTVLLPCEECREALKKKLESIPLEKYISNNHDAFFLSYLIHDMANEDINSKHPDIPVHVSPTFEDIKNFFFSGLGKECKMCHS